LLGDSELVEKFLEAKRNGTSQLAILASVSQEHGSGHGDASLHRHRRPEREADQDELEVMVEGEELDEEADVMPGVIFTESPAFVKGGKMRDYQVQGLNWLLNLYHHSINGILADEMGLGKTLQTLSLLGYLKAYCDVPGPHLLIVPKSTLQNWMNEATRWIPDSDAFILHGDKEKRAELIKSRLAPRDFEICIASFETCMIEKAALRKIPWTYLIIDEAHRIKNENSSLSQIVRMFNVQHRLLLTGTPLQNNLHELWALLNFLLPDVFGSADDFDSYMNTEGGADQSQLIEQLRRLLAPFLLRRLKADVEHSLLPKKEINLYVGMTEMQKKWYRRLLEKDLDALNGVGEGRMRLQNVLMQLRKCANHPYLFEGAEPGPPFTTDEHLVQNSGKMLLLDRLLARLKSNGSRVLLFSQMSRVLDILEDYCQFRGYAYCRIDGQTEHEDRISAIEEYNKPGSDKFIFLLTTRAGGLGINLATADIVILYDSDWNPQVDLQAQDRAHRIGQTKQVCVFRLITEHTVEEKVIERALQKLRLDQLVIQQGKLTNANKALTQDEMLAMIRHGAEALFTEKADGQGLIDDAQVEEILRRGESKTRELLSKYQNAGLEDLQRFTMDAGSSLSHGWESSVTGGAADGGSGFKYIQPPRRDRERKPQHYSVDGYFREAMGFAPRGSNGANRNAKAPMPRNILALHDYQFFPDELRALQEREILAHQRAAGYVVPEAADEDEERKAERLAEQAAIEGAEGLTEEELARKEELVLLGFPNWTRRDHHALLRALERHGRQQEDQSEAEYEALLHAELSDSGKTSTELHDYLAVFWQRYTELQDGEKITAILERTEARIQRIHQVRHLLAKRVQRSERTPLLIPYFNGKGKDWIEPEDAFLLRALHRHGYGPEDVYERIHAEILTEPAFRFNWFVKTRTPLELSRRAHKLIGFLEKEEEREEKAVPAKRGKPRR